MKRFIEGVDRDQATLFPERLDDYVGGDKPSFDRRLIVQRQHR